MSLRRPKPPIKGGSAPEEEEEEEEEEASGIVTLCWWPSGAQSSLNLCTGRPPTGVTIPDVV